MQKTIFTTILILSLLGGLGFFLFFQEKPVWDIGYKTSTDTSLDTQKEQQALIEKENKKNMDFYNSALKDLNPKLCEWLTKEKLKDECRNMIGATQAKKAGDITACNALTNTGITLLCRDAIRSDRAVTTRNKILCEKITDTERKTYCKEQIDELILQANAEENTITKDLCNKLWDEQKWTCLSEVQQIDETNLYQEAILKNDIALCETIKKIELRTNCSDTINIKEAFNQKNIALCNKISHQEKKNYCVNQITKDSEEIISEKAIEENDIAQCTKISNIDLKNKCNDTIIINRLKLEKDPSLCEKFTNKDIIESCRKKYNTTTPTL